MMSLGSTILKSIGKFSEEEIALLETKTERKTYKKNDIILQEGQICKFAFYIVSGTAYQYSYEDIDENIIGLHTEQDWCLNYFSFIHQKPSEAIIKAYSDLEVVELTLTSIHELIAISPSFFKMGKILEQTVSRIQYFDNAYTALQKHNHLFLYKPELFQKFPLKMIASYINVTPETLSRIRNIR